MSSGTKTILKDGSPDMRQSRGNFCVRLRAEDRLRGRLRRRPRVLSTLVCVKTNVVRDRGVASAEPERAVRK